MVLVGFRAWGVLRVYGLGLRPYSMEAVQPARCTYKRLPAAHGIEELKEDPYKGP